MGGNFTPAEPKTHFQFPKQEKSFVRAVLRCVGVGKCRNEEGGLMCPSYMATRDEKHSTRGRAHLLFEMLKGEAIKDGWKSEEVKEALDLCLSCKGCKSDCPTNVDMATYKAEFLPITTKAACDPATPTVRIYRAVGAARDQESRGWRISLRRLPGSVMRRNSWWEFRPNEKFQVSTETFRSSFKRSAPSPVFQSPSPLSRERASENKVVAPPLHTQGRGVGGEGVVVLWPDTFTNYFQPQIGQAAVEVLEQFGFRVLVPEHAQLCCGRPLYDYGFLDQAKRQLQDILSC